MITAEGSSTTEKKNDVNFTAGNYMLEQYKVRVKFVMYNGSTSF